MGRLDQRICLITGGGNGIGRACGRRFAAEGALVILADIDADAAVAAAAEVAAQGGRAESHRADVTKGQDISALFRHIETVHGRLDVVVNNAGVTARNEFRHMTDSEWERVRDVNLDGVVRIARDSFELLRKSGRGSLINLSSIMGHRGLRQLAAYSATKGAVTALTKAMAIEYAQFGIRVNAIAPGFIETAMTKRVLSVPQINKALLERTALKRFGTPDDIAGAALFLASDDSAYVTGTEIAVDGGMRASL
jgi:NAD(P)-dependent dehydrogenase (short-subunit alcohol dehydrogenase family)